MNKKVISILLVGLFAGVSFTIFALAQNDNEEFDDTSSVSQEGIVEDTPDSMTPEEQEYMNSEREKYEREKWELDEKIEKGLYSEPYYPPQTQEEKEIRDQVKKESELQSQKIKENNQIVKGVLNRIYGKKYKIDITEWLGYDPEVLTILQDVIAILKTHTLDPTEKKALQIYTSENIIGIDEHEQLYIDGESVLQNLTFDPADPYELYD